MTDTSTIHVASSTGDGTGCHTVGVFNLRVFILNDGGMWYAQGVEIDYLASGSSLEGVKKAFEKGLQATFSAYIDKYQDVSAFLKPAAEDVVHEFEVHSTAKGYKFWQLTKHTVDMPVQEKLFVRVGLKSIMMDFIEPKLAA